MRDRRRWDALRAVHRVDGDAGVNDALTPFDPAQICARIDELRTVLEMSWVELETLSGVSEARIRRWWSGAEVPRIKSVGRVAEAMGSVYDEITRGLRQRCEATEAPAGAVSGYDPRQSAVGGAFVGRRATMQSLAAAREQRRSVNVVGDRRIGKSSVVETWGQQVRACGSVVASVSSGRCETASSLVRAVTWAPAPDDPEGAAAALAAWAREHRRAGAQPLIVIDDLDRLAQRDDRFLYPLRELIQDATVTMVVSTRTPLNEPSPSGHLSPLAGMFVTEHLGLLEADAVDALIGSHPLALAAEDAELLHIWSGRHPFYLKLLAHHLVHAPREHAVARFRTEAARELFKLWHKPWRNHLDRSERAALRGVVYGETAPERALRALQSRGLLTEGGKPFGQVLTAWLEDLPESARQKSLVAVPPTASSFSFTAYSLGFAPGVQTSTVPVLRQTNVMLVPFWNQ